MGLEEVVTTAAILHCKERHLEVVNVCTCVMYIQPLDIRSAKDNFKLTQTDRFVGFKCFFFMLHVGSKCIKGVLVQVRDSSV